MLMTSLSGLTLVHAIEYEVELLLCVFTVVFPPALPRLAPQDDQLPLCSPQGSKVGDFHDHRPGRRAQGSVPIQQMVSVFGVMRGVKNKNKHPNDNVHICEVREQAKHWDELTQAGSQIPQKTL